MVSSSSLVGETLGSSWHLRHHPPLMEIQNMPLATTSYKGSKEEESMSVPYLFIQNEIHTQGTQKKDIKE